MEVTKVADSKLVILRYVRIWRIIGGTFPALAVINCGSCDKENQTQVYVVKAKFIQEYDNRGKYTPACNWASFTI